MRIRRGFDLDPSCKLWLPFYKYGAEQPKIYDQSGNNNHGTITGAVPYPGNPQATPVGSTFNRGDFTATNAFFWSSLDLSSYAGSDVGSTSHWIELTDGAGKKAIGYIGAVGAGEAGNELATDGDFAVDPGPWLQTGGWTIAGGVGVGTATGGYIYQPISHAVKSLVKFKFDLVTRTSGELYMGGDGVGFSSFLSIPDTYTHYRNITSPNANAFLYGNPADVFTGTVDNFSAVQLTDPPSTAVHIVSSLNGTTRDWASTESGFDPNTIASWKINSVISKECIGWYFDDVDDRIVHPSINFGKTQTLFYWLRSFANAKDIIHGGAANNHVAIDVTNLYYNAGATELSQAHGGGMNSSTMIGIVRSGTTVQFFKNGVQVGADQTLDANNDLTLTTLCSYDTPGTFFGGTILEDKGFTRAFSAQEIRNYYEMTRGRFS